MVSEDIIHARFKWQSNATPDLVALRCDNNALTYQNWTNIRMHWRSD